MKSISEMNRNNKERVTKELHLLCEVVLSG